MCRQTPDFNGRKMTDEKHSDQADIAETTRKFEDLPAPAQRALKEAEERRAKAKADQKDAPKELGGRGGEDPARYGDWEVKGIAIDF